MNKNMEKRYIAFEYRKGLFRKITQKSELNQFFTNTKSSRSIVFNENTPSTWMEVNLSNLSKNIHALYKYLGKKIPIIAIVKCDAYGHGLIPICRELVQQGISKLGVSSLSEAKEIISARIKTPIVLLYPFSKDHVAFLVKKNIEITISNIENLEWILDYARKNIRKKVKIHLSFSIGIDSDGMKDSEFFPFIDTLVLTKNIIVEGICGVLSNENANKSTIETQSEKFRRIVKYLYISGITPTSVHLANSESVDIHPGCLENITMIDGSITCYARLGRWLYGTYSPTNKKIEKLYPVLSSVVSRVIQVRKFGSGKSVGYFGMYKTKAEEIIATIPFGWGSCGILLKNAIVHYKGHVFHQVGAMSANALHFKVGPKIDIGDRVVIVDTNSTNHFHWPNLEKSTSTFVSQIITQLGAKVSRVYFSEI